MSGTSGKFDEVAQLIVPGLRKGSGGPIESASENPGILDAVRDQHGEHRFLFGTPGRSCWFSISELMNEEKSVFARIAGTGAILLTSNARQNFKQGIENHREFRPALVASHPGWIDASPVYVFGDHSIVAPKGNELPEITLAFEPNTKFTPRGSSKRWLAKVGRVIANQPLPLFTISYGFVGPILRFGPPSTTNPACEIVGEMEVGKSIIGATAASIYAGNPTSEAGGGESWDATVNVLDLLKVAHADSLLFIDEVNLAGDDRAAQEQLMHKAAFKLASKGGKKRLTDSARIPNVRIAVLSTSNEPIGDLIKANKTVRKAGQSRMMTIVVEKDSPHGVLATLPPGFTDSRHAMDYLFAAINRNYGRIGRRFVRRLVEAAARNETALRRYLAKRYDYYMQRARFLMKAGSSARHAHDCALTYAAASLARKWGLIPKEWGSLLRSILAIHAAVIGTRKSASATAMDRIRAYLKSNDATVIDANRVRAPYSAAVFRQRSGFRMQFRGRREILIPSARFQQEFPDYEALMHELKDAGRTRTEGGKAPKLTIKAPTKLCAGARVYCIRID